MSYSVKRKNKKEKQQSGWDAMIADAKKRIGQLQSAIQVFEKKKTAGEKWPGVQIDDGPVVLCATPLQQSATPLHGQSPHQTSTPCHRI